MIGLGAALALAAGAARAEGADATEEPGPRLESVEVALTAFEQDGAGYQSQAGRRVSDPGSERLTVFEPQVLASIRQSARVRHQVWIPFDMVTSASANATDSRRTPPDMMSQASRQNQAGTLDWTTTYAARRGTDVALRDAFHLEENFRSWTTALSAMSLPVTV